MAFRILQDGIGHVDLYPMDCVLRVGVCQSPNVYVRPRVKKGVGV